MRTAKTAQADLSLHWMHSNFVGFVMRRLKYFARKATSLKLEQKFNDRRKSGIKNYLIYNKKSSLPSEE